MSKILVVDHSVVSQQSFHGLFTQTYQGETNDTLIELVHAYAQHIIRLGTMIRPDRIYFVMDCPRAEVWRHKPIKQYYKGNFAAWSFQTEDGEEQYLVEVDCKRKKIWRNEEGMLVNKVCSKPDWEDTMCIVAGEGVATPLTSDQPIYRELFFDAYPAYKGNRKSGVTKGGMEMDEVKELTSKLAAKLSEHLNGWVLGPLDGCEADDLAYAVHCVHPEDELFYITTDRDWLQLHTDKARFWDLRNHKEMEPTDKAAITHMMRMKLLRGDESDHIQPVRLMDKRSQLTEKKAEDLLKTLSTAELKTMMSEEPSFMRNREVILLKQAPVEIKEACREVVEAAKAAPDRKMNKAALKEHISASVISIAVAEGQEARDKARETILNPFRNSAQADDTGSTPAS